MTDIESIKTELALVLNRVLAERAESKTRNVIEDWSTILALTRVDTARFSFSQREIDNSYSDDEIVFSKTVDFFGDSYLQECCTPGSDCLAGSRCIPIAGVDGADEFLFITNTPNLDVTILHHDDVYVADDLDKIVHEKAERTELPLLQFLEILQPETTLAKFMASTNASKWLVVEQNGKLVRYEFNLTAEWDDGEQSFNTTDEAETFFFDTIRRGVASTALSIISCSSVIHQQVETIIESP